MNNKDFMNAVVEYVELTDGMLSAPKAPAFNKEAMEKTASALVGANLIRPNESKVLVESFSKDPNRALEVLQKVAERFVTKEAATVDSSIGSPVEASRPSERPQRESDRVFLERFKLNN
jgi:hypothetical protein